MTSAARSHPATRGSFGYAFAASVNDRTASVAASRRMVMVSRAAGNGTPGVARGPVLATGSPDDLGSRVLGPRSTNIRSVSDGSSVIHAWRLAMTSPRGHAWSAYTPNTRRTGLGRFGMPDSAQAKHSGNKLDECCTCL